MDELTLQRTAELIKSAARRPAARRPQDRRLLRSVSGRGQHRKRRAEAARARTRAHRCHQGSRRAGAGARRHAARRRRCAQQHQPAHRESLRSVGRAGPERSDALPALPAAGRPRDARPRLLPEPVAEDGRHPHPVPGAHRSGAGRWRSVPDAHEQGRARSSPSSGASPQAHWSRAGVRGRAARATTTGAARTSRAGTGPRLGSDSSPPPGLAHQDEFVVWQPSALTGIATLVGSEPLETWKDFLRFHLIEANAAYLPKAFVEEHFEFHGRILSGTPQQRAALEARRRTRPMTRSARRSASCTSSAISRPARRRAPRRWSRTCWPPSPCASISSSGWRPQTRARGQGQARRAQGRRRLPGSLAQLRGPARCMPGDAFGNAQRAELFEYQRNLAKLGTAGRPLRVGDEPAAGQRGEPAGDECAQLSRPRSCSRPTSIRSATR